MSFKRVVAAAILSASAVSSFAAGGVADSILDGQIGGSLGLDIGDVVIGGTSDVLVSFDMWTSVGFNYGLPSSISVLLSPASAVATPTGSSAVGADPLFNALIGTNVGYSASFSGISAGTYDIVVFGNDGMKNLAFGNVSASVTAVPEPETYAMMLAGLGAIGFMARRRQAK